jgi:hypothetical protein
VTARILLCLFSVAATFSCAERAAPLRGLCGTPFDCGPDLNCDGGFCVPPACPIDTAWDREARTCTACPAGTRSDDRRATVCTAIDCPLDTRWEPSSRRCASCAVDTVSDGGAATDCRAIDCPVDTRWEASARACVSCPSGTSSEGGLVRECESWACAPHTRWSAVDRACVPCADGEWSNGGDVDACLPADCTPGERWDVLLRACTSCPSAETSAGGAVLVCDLVDCPTDRRWDAATRACVACDPGTYSDGGAVVACAPPDCPPDQHWSEAPRGCVPCPGGTTSTGGAVVACVPLTCARDERIDAAADACIPCPTGTISDGGSATGCRAIDCPRDEVWSGDDHACVPCPVGRHSVGGDATVCHESCLGDAFGPGVPLAGSLQWSGTTPPTDGTGTTARFAAVSSFRRDPSDGSLLVLDGGLRRVTPAGVVTTLLGADALCASASYRVAYSGLAVALDGSAYWFCGSDKLRRRAPDGVLTTLSLPASRPLNPQALTAGLDGGLYLAAGWRSCGPGDPVYPACIETWLWRVASDGALTSVWRNAGLDDAVTVVSDVAVTADGVAFLADPNGGRILRIDPVAATAAPVRLPQGASGAMGQHLVLDTAGRLYAEGQSVSPAGTLVGTFEDRSLQWGIALTGPDDDVVQAECEWPNGAGACRLLKYPRLCP